MRGGWLYGIVNMKLAVVMAGWLGDFAKRTLPLRANVDGEDLDVCATRLGA